MIFFAHNAFTPSHDTHNYMSHLKDSAFRTHLNTLAHNIKESEKINSVVFLQRFLRDDSQDVRVHRVNSKDDSCMRASEVSRSPFPHP